MRNCCGHLRILVPEVGCTNPKTSATKPQGIRGYISVTATLKFIHFLIKRIMFFLNNGVTVGIYNLINFLYPISELVSCNSTYAA
jgi:hypothetical protein